jgi:hypothetical protein
VFSFPAQPWLALALAHTQSNNTDSDRPSPKQNLLNLSNERTSPIQRHIAGFATRPPRYQNDSRKSTGSVRPGRAGILPLKQGLCRVCPFYWQQIIKRPSHRAVVQGRPSHTLLLSLIPRPPPQPQFNPANFSNRPRQHPFPSIRSVLHNSSSVSLSFSIDLDPDSDLLASPNCSTIVSRLFCLRPEAVKRLAAITFIPLPLNSSALLLTY